MNSIFTYACAAFFPESTITRNTAHCRHAFVSFSNHVLIDWIKNLCGEALIAAYMINETISINQIMYEAAHIAGHLGEDQLWWGIIAISATVINWELHMLMIINAYVRDLVVRFKSDEEGLALTEYVILLGLLTAAVIGAVLLFGGALDEIWRAWVAFISSLDNNVPAPIAS